jgi:GT2 family glycosyltransferase
VTLLKTQICGTQRFGANKWEQASVADTARSATCQFAVQQVPGIAKGFRGMAGPAVTTSGVCICKCGMRQSHSWDRSFMQPLVYIIVLNWNGHLDTMRCVASLEQQDYPNLRILIIDNGSTDDSLTVMKGLGDRVTLIELPQNLGYTGGNNHAMRVAFDRGAEYVWLFNNDAIAETDTLSRLIAACEADPKIGLASPLIREEDNHDAIQFACGLFDLATPVYTPCYVLEQAQAWQTQYSDRIALVGTAMLIRRSVFEKIGVLDDRIFAYWEDIDYSIRSALAGFRNIMVFETSIFHPSKSSIASPNDVRPHYYYFMTRNEILMWRTFCSPLQILKATFWVFRRQLRQIKRMPGNAAGLDAMLAGVWDGCWGVGGSYNPRHRVPFPIRQIFGGYPQFWLRLVDGKR